jgi:hypothetical protein
VARLTLVPAAILVTETSALICQFVQATDPRFPLVYFTVGSAVLAAVSATVAMAFPRCSMLSSLRVNAAGGVILSAIVFAVVIAPASPTGTWIQPHDDYWVRAATILMHGLAPLLVTLDVVLRPPANTLAWQVIRSFTWPLTYLALIAVLAASKVVAVPYPFLDPRWRGWDIVILAIAAFSALVVVVAATLYGLTRLRWAYRQHIERG